MWLPTYIDTSTQTNRARTKKFRINICKKNIFYSNSVIFSHEIKKFIKSKKRHIRYGIWLCTHIILCIHTHIHPSHSYRLNSIKKWAKKNKKFIWKNFVLFKLELNFFFILTHIYLYWRRNEKNVRSKKKKKSRIILLALQWKRDFVPFQICIITI